MIKEPWLCHIPTGKVGITEDVCRGYSWQDGFAQYFYALRNSDRAKRKIGEKFADGSQDIDVVTIDINDEDRKLFPEITRYDYVMMLLSENDECILFDYIK